MNNTATDTPDKSVTKPKRIQIDSLVKSSLALLLLWLAGFLIIRLFCLSAYVYTDGGLLKILIAALAWDAAGFAVFWLIWLPFALFFGLRSATKYAAIVLMVVAFILGIINALFVAWAHAPLDPSFFMYVSSVGDLSTSAFGLLPPWYLTILYSIMLIGVLVCVWIYGLNQGWITKISNRVLIGSVIATLLLLAVGVFGINKWENS